MKTDKKIEEIVREMQYRFSMAMTPEEFESARKYANTEVQKAVKRAVIEYSERLGNRLIEIAPVEHSTLDAITFVLHEYLYLQTLKDKE